MPTRASHARAMLVSIMVVAPNPTLGEAVVATAWRHRLTCRSVDLTALRAFISTRADKGPA